MYIHVLMRDEKEGRKKQARSNKKQRTQHTQGSHFKNELPRVGLEPTTLYILDRVLSQATKAAQLAGPKSHIS